MENAGYLVLATQALWPSSGFPAVVKSPNTVFNEEEIEKVLRLRPPVPELILKIPPTVAKDGNEAEVNDQISLLLQENEPTVVNAGYDTDDNKDVWPAFAINCPVTLTNDGNESEVNAFI